MSGSEVSLTTVPFDTTGFPGGADDTDVPAVAPKKLRGRRTIDAHHELMKLVAMGVVSFEAVCLVRKKRADEVFVQMPGLRDGVQLSSRLLEEAAEVASDLTCVLAENACVTAVADMADDDVFFHVRAVVGIQDALPFLHGEVQALAGGEGAQAARNFGLL